MRILHTADWHLGKKLEAHSRLEEQREVLSEICELADQYRVDAVVVAGDLFDTFNPPTEAVELLYSTLKRLSKNGERAVIAIAGNHDSPDRIEAPDPLSLENGILLIGYPHSQVRPFSSPSGLAVTKSDQGFVELQLPGSATPFRLIHAPYANEQRLRTFLGANDTDQDRALQAILADQWQGLAKQYLDDQGINLLAAHLFMIPPGSTTPEEPEGEKPINHPGGATAIDTTCIPEKIHYTALGHLHGYRRLSGAEGPAVYSSSPLAYSFQEAGQTKYVNLIKAETGQPVEQQALPLRSGKPLSRQRFTSVAQASEWLTANPDSLVELTLATDTYISSQDRRQLHQLHDGIIHLIPELSADPASAEAHSRQIDLQQDLTTLFQDYFEHQQGQPPNEEMLALFREILQARKNEDQKAN